MYLPSKCFIWLSFICPVHHIHFTTSTQDTPFRTLYLGKADNCLVLRQTALIYFTFYRWLVFRFIRKTLYLVITHKAHSEKALRVFHEKQWFSLKKWWFSLGNLINQLIQDKSFSFIVCLGEAMSDDSMKTAAFH